MNLTHHDESLCSWCHCRVAAASGYVENITWKSWLPHSFFSNPSWKNPNTFIWGGLKEVPSIHSSGLGSLHPDHTNPNKSMTGALRVQKLESQRVFCAKCPSFPRETFYSFLQAVKGNLNTPHPPNLRIVTPTSSRVKLPFEHALTEWASVKLLCWVVLFHER